MSLSQKLLKVLHTCYSSNIASFFTLFIMKSFAKHLMVLVYASERRYFCTTGVSLIYNSLEQFIPDMCNFL